MKPKKLRVRGRCIAVLGKRTIQPILEDHKVCASIISQAALVGGDRHPKIGDGVLIGAGATILGNVRVGEGAKVGAGSLVLSDVPPWTTAVGNPARLVGGKEKPKVHVDVPGESMDHTSFISDWSDYVI